MLTSISILTGIDTDLALFIDPTDRIPVMNLSAFPYLYLHYSATTTNKCRMGFALVCLHSAPLPLDSKSGAAMMTRPS
uniref:Uncharacterized protein n=1 Tax=Heterorhabditis bacteriophora TaxID=37862 RepID=A0A1I7WQS4_HETBA